MQTNSRGNVRAYLLSLLDVSISLFSGLLLALSLLEKSLRYQDLILGWGRSISLISMVHVTIIIAESELQLWCGILDLDWIWQTRRNVFNR